MYAQERQQDILRRARLAGRVDVVTLAEALDVTTETIRRDLTALERQGLLHRVHGGAIAVGHPFGMTGARIATTLLNGLRAKDATIGLETMCVGGGQGMAMVVERLR